MEAIEAMDAPEARQELTIDILCKVVDNFGDIGVVYRLARALSEVADRDLPSALATATKAALPAASPAAATAATAPATRNPALKLRLVVDNLESFRALCPGIDPGLPLQEARGWTVANWAGQAEVRAAFAEKPPRLVIEAFACGRPDWFEELLFDPIRPENRLIVNLEYLSAEDWADDFHLMDSITRSSEVKKRIFMPGFTARTGGLILDRDFQVSREACASPDGLAGQRRRLLALLGTRDASPLVDAFWFPVFSYERDYGPIVAELAAFARGPLARAGRPLLALAAAGKSQACFLAAWEKAGHPFRTLALPFLPQETWDALLLASDFAIVRGEDSLSRAALSGRPFLWQAYPQEGRHQLVKVRALLERLKPFLPATSFEELAAASLAFNDRDADHPAERGRESILTLLEACLPQAAIPAVSPQPKAALPAASPQSEAALPAAFSAFARELLSHGNLALPLLGLFRDFR